MARIERTELIAANVIAEALSVWRRADLCTADDWRRRVPCRCRDCARNTWTPTYRNPRPPKEGPDE